MPRYKGQATSMWKLIEAKSMPPTRFQRYCCTILKEASTPNRMVALGVREAESKNRQGRDAFGVRGRRKTDGEYRSTGHTFAMFQLDKYGGEDAYQCEMIKACKKNKDTIVNPIYRFTDSDIWEYINTFAVTTNPLYAQGFKRVGCIGCPLAGPKQMLNEFARWPKYKTNYIKAFERMQKRNEERGINNKLGIRNGLDWFNWWIGENPKQIRIDEITERKV